MTPYWLVLDSDRYWMAFEYLLLLRNLVQWSCVVVANMSKLLSGVAASCRYIWCGERYVAADCSGKGFYCAHFLLQRSHTVYCLFLFPHLRSRPHSAKISTYFPATNPIYVLDTLCSSSPFLLPLKPLLCVFLGEFLGF